MAFCLGRGMFTLPKLKSPFFPPGDAAWESVQAAGVLPSPGVDVRASKQFCDQRLLFCVATCQTLDWIRVFVRLLTWYFSSSVSHLKDFIFHKSRKASISNSMWHLRQREERLRWTQLCAIKVKSTWHHRTWGVCGGNCQIILDG